MLNNHFLNNHGSLLSFVPIKNDVLYIESTDSIPSYLLMTFTYVRMYH